MAAWTCDEFYGRDHEFLDGLEQRGQAFVAEIPVVSHGWLQRPRLLYLSRKRRQPTKHPRVARRCPSSEVRHLVRHSPTFHEQTWQRYHIKDTQKGPEVWEVKWAPFWRRGEHGLPGRRHCLIAARNVLTEETKYFLANRVPGQKGVTLRWLLRVAFGRWSVEHCFREAKEELGMDHYEVRGWGSIHRHFFVTQLSHLFCARVRQEYDSPTEPLTIEQVRSAINTWLDAVDLKPSARQGRYLHQLSTQAYYQRRNAQAQKSHRLARITELQTLGIQLNKIKSCVARD